MKPVTVLQRAALIASLSLLGLPLAGRAQTPAPSAELKAATPGESLGSWWERTPLSYATVPTQFLFHGQGNLHYMNASGNTNGNVGGGSVQLWFRKQRLTNFVSESLERNSIVYAFNAGSAHFTQNTVLDQLDFDLTNTLALVGGVEDYRDTMIFIDKRLTGYGGLGFTPLARERFGVTFVGAGGYSSFRFDGNGINQVQPGLASTLPTLTPSSGGGMVSDSVYWQALPTLRIEQTLRYMKFSNSILGHRLDFGVNLQIPITKRFSITPGYQILDQANVYTTALHLKPQDRTFNLGLGISF